MNRNRRDLMIDGKPVKCWLFARLSRVAIPCLAMIPTDDGRRFTVLAQVEGFSLDHAWKRLTEEIYPAIPRVDWQMLAELDPEHDCGMLGSKHPILSIIEQRGSRNLH